MENKYFSNFPSPPYFREAFHSDSKGFNNLLWFKQDWPQRIQFVNILFIQSYHTYCSSKFCMFAFIFYPECTEMHRASIYSFWTLYKQVILTGDELGLCFDWACAPGPAPTEGRETCCLGPQSPLWSWAMQLLCCLCSVSVFGSMSLTPVNTRSCHCSTGLKQVFNFVENESSER